MKEKTSEKALIKTPNITPSTEEKDNFTPEQRRVRDSFGVNLLVSASAGTGKTTVMVERIVQLLAQNKITLDNILVVTFTNYAAAKMKEKLRERIGEKIKEGNKHLASQLEKIDLASISTIDSFCLDVLRNYFYVADLDPSFVVIDAQQADIYKERAFDETMRDFSQSGDQTFFSLYRIFADTRKEEQLKKQIIKVHDFSKLFEDFGAWYSEKIQYYHFDNNSEFIKDLFEDFKFTINDYADKLNSYALKAKSFSATGLASFCEKDESLFRISPDATADQCRNYLNEKPAYERFNKGYKVLPPNYTGDVEEFENLVEAINNTIAAAKSYRKKYSDNASMFDIDTQRELAHRMLPIIDKLVEVVKKFDENYTKIKKERACLDFSDLEHFAIKVLKDKTAADELKSKYKMIFMDEYQDVNGVQEKIIELLKGEDNLFFVGDIKQSIYGFRASDPDIFAKKMETYRSGKNEVIVLNQNFRSDNRILEVVNAVFLQCMSREFGKVDYSTAQLVSEIGDDNVATPVEIESFGTPAQEKTETPTTFYDMASDTSAPQSSPESLAVLQKIRQLVGTTMKIGKVERKVEYSDIAILTRTSTKIPQEIYDTLTAENIPVDFSPKDKVGTKECLDLINFLRAIDNPYNEIYLAGVCLSHFGKMSKEELAEIKIASPKTKLFDAICYYANDEKDLTAENEQRNEEGIAVNQNQTVTNQKDENTATNQKDEIANDNSIVNENQTPPAKNPKLQQKAAQFVKFFNRYQSYAFALSADTILQKLIIETKYNLFVLSMPNGQLRCERMYRMLQSAYNKSFSESVAKYIQYVDLFGDSDTPFIESKNGVKMTTVHKSKGLEFPIVIGAALNSGGRDMNKLKINKTMGLAIKNYDLSTQTVEKSLSVFEVEKTNAFNEREEELRLLYVLMTRAQNYLYLLVPETKEIIARPRDAANMTDWLWYCKDKGVIDIKPFTPSTAETLKSAGIEKQNVDKEKILQDLAYKYPYQKYIDTPSKIVASKLKEYSRPQEEIEETIQVERDLITKPDNNATYIGTAYHKVFENLSPTADKDEISLTIQKLIKEGKIDVDISANINIDAIYNCLQNPDFKQLLKGETYNEIRFMLKAPFNEFVPDSDNTDKVTLQGTIDLLVVNGDSAIIVDFKYTSHPERIIENYTPQISAYVKAAKQILKLENVGGYVLSIKNNKVIKLV